MVKFATFDIESTEWIHFEVMGFYDGEEYKPFWSIPKFLTHLNQKRYQSFRIYAHNGGKFDFLFIVEELLKRGWITKIIERQGRIIAIRCATDKGVKFTFADSYALLPSSLRKLCETFKPKHFKGEIDYSKISAHDKDTLDYLESDVLALWEILYDFFSSDYIIEPQLTIASQAMNTFRHKFFDGEVTQLRLYYEDIMRRDFYSGGRVEMFKGYGKKINVYDVNSLFPYAMLQPMPTGEMIVTDRYVRNRIGFYNITVTQTTDFYISPLLHRADKLLFINGPGAFNVGTPTLDILRELGVRFKINYGYYFDGKEHLFVDYVRTFYDLKQRNKGGALYQISKLFLNGLYGRFAMRREREAIVPATGYEEGAVPPSVGTMLDTWGMVLVKEESRSRFIAPYLAAYITELARAHHYRLMMLHPEEMYYCDTDSLFTTATYKTGTGIGELSHEGLWQEGVFLGNKTYSLLGAGGKQKTAFRGFEVKELTFSALRDSLFNGAPIQQERDHILSFRECLDTRKADRSEGLFLKIRKTTKKAKQAAYDKRQVFASKRHVIETAPHTFTTLKEK